MKKRNKRGFILAETITVSVVVMTALILIYTQFININRSYQNSFRYNTVDKLYAVNNILSFLKTDDLQNLVDKLDKEYIDITSCQSEYIFEYLYCQNLMTNLDIKQVLFTKEDTTDLKKVIKDDPSLSEEIKDFIKALVIDKETDRYRLIVEFNDNTFASLKTEKLISNSSIVKNVSNNCAKNGNTCTLDQIKTGVSMNVEVKSGEIHKFYVLSDNGTNLTLIMDRNIDINADGALNSGDSVAWQSNGNNYNGPTTVLAKLDIVTNTWINLNDISYSLTGTDNDTYNCCYEAYGCAINRYTVTPSSFKARLPRVQELHKLYDPDYPAWLYDYTENASNSITGIKGYWTSTSNERAGDNAWYMANNFTNGYGSVSGSSEIGIRPVIVINKSII